MSDLLCGPDKIYKNVAFADELAERARPRSAPGSWLPPATKQEESPCRVDLSRPEPFQPEPDWSGPTKPGAYD
jgi:hypothetical protein